MKKFLSIFALTLIFAATSCTSDATQTSTAGTSSENTESSDNAVETEDDNAEVTDGDVEEEVVEEKELDMKDVATIQVTDKKNIEADISNGVYSDRVNITVQVTNNSEQPIKGVSGVLEINDLFDKSILKINCNFTGQIIEPSATATFDTLGLDINEFMSDHVKFYNENFEDLNFNYNVKDIVFYDATQTNETTNKAPYDSKVNVSVQGKESTPADIFNGIYSSRVRFIFEVSNLTDKDIKGVQGIITTYDIFGNQITKNNCDFTGEIIPANGAVIFDTLGFDINEFLSDEVLLYNTSYDDLVFEYETTAIVYGDGTTE